MIGFFIFIDDLMILYRYLGSCNVEVVFVIKGRCGIGIIF